MKFGIIAAVLVVLGVLIWFGFERVPEFLTPILAVYLFLIGPPIVFIISIVGIVKDKHKYLAVLTMLLVIAWIIFWSCLLIIYDMREPPY